jgi:hypothetical protein
MSSPLTERDLVRAKREGYVAARVATDAHSQGCIRLGVYEECPGCAHRLKAHQAEARRLYPLPGIPNEVQAASGSWFRLVGDEVLVKHRNTGAWGHYTDIQVARAIAELVAKPTVPDPEDGDGVGR